MRIAAAAILILALGCSNGEPTDPQLRYVGLGMDQGKIAYMPSKIRGDSDRLPPGVVTMLRDYLNTIATKPRRHRRVSA